MSETNRSVPRGGADTVLLTITRGGSYTGTVTLSVENAPAGVTAIVTTPTLTGDSLTSRVVFTATDPAALGLTILTFRATGAGVTAQAVTFALTVVPRPLILGVTGTALSLSRSGAASTAITLTRANLPGPVTMSAEGLPAGVSASFSPNPAADSITVLTLSADAGATLGASTVTVRALGTSGVNATAMLPVNVLSAGAGASITWRFCPTEIVPAWFAVRSGTAGPFVPVAKGPNSTFSFVITSDVAAVAWAETSAGYGAVQLHLASATELAELATQSCYVAPTYKSLTIPVAGLAASQVGRVIIGGGGGGDIALPSTSIDATGVLTGNVDLFALRGIPSGGDPALIPDRYVIRRNVNYPAGSTIPTIDFSTAEAFAPVGATLTVANAGGEAVWVRSSFRTARGGGEVSFTPTQLTAATSYARFGVPASRIEAGEFHITTVNRFPIADQDYRTIEVQHREFADRTLTFGPALVSPTMSTLATAPYLLLRAAGPWQAGIDEEISMEMQQSAGSVHRWQIDATRAYLGAGAATYTIDLPDLSAVPGFQTAWGLAPGVPVSVQTVARTRVLRGFAEGATFRAASRGAPVFTP